MTTLSPLAAVLLQTSLLIGLTLCVHVCAVRYLTSDDVPDFLWRRIELLVRMRPVVLTGAVALGAAGLVLGVR